MQLALDEYKEKLAQMDATVELLRRMNKSSLEIKVCHST